jgi:DHA1 family bicyclomycin/chloramphenicol resistance-like MFS transporter
MGDGNPLVTARQRRGTVGLLLAMVLLGVFPLDVVLPSFPALAEHFQTNQADIALSVSLYAVGIAFAQLLIGPLSDLIGRKSLLLTGMAVSMLGALGCVITRDFTWFLVFRLLQALGCGCFVLSQALVQDLFEGDERARLRILMITASGIFISLSPLAGTYLQASLGWRGSFWVFIGLATVVFIKAGLFLDSRPASHAPRRNILQCYRQVLGSFDFVGYWLISAFAFSCHFSFIVTSPLIFMEQMKIPANDFSLILLVYGAAYVFGGIIASVLSQRIAPSKQILVGASLILLSGLLMLYLTTYFALNATVVLVPMLFCTLGTTIIRPAATSEGMNLFPEIAGTSASAGSTLTFICGGLISALVSLSPINLQMTLGLCFILLSSVVLALNCRIGNRGQSMDIRPETTSE